MLLLALDGLLLLFITLGQGVLFKSLLEKVFRCTAETGILGLFLAGLVLTTVYFSVVSFWWPVNYLCLLPLVIINGLFFVFNKPSFGLLLQLIRQRARFMFSGSRLLPAVCLLLLLCCYLVKAPGQPDSVGYHYLSILWYEKFRVVPGLANLHGRFAFNPASFIVQAAYSFTDPLGQPVYPLNGVITGLLLYWLLARLCNQLTSYRGLVYFLLLLMLGRAMLGNMSSPSSDILVLVCVLYPLIRFFELTRSNETNIGSLLIPLLVALYAPMAKLSAFPVAPIILFMLLRLPGNRTRLLLAGRLLLTALVIYLPWLGRNVILSGYLVYPLPFTGFFHTNWQVPRAVLLIDYNNAKYSPIFGWDLTALGQTPSVTLRHWLLPWLEKAYRFAPAVFFMLIAAFTSPLLWLAGFFARKWKTANAQDVLYWLVYAAVWLWLMTSPDFRFGIGFVSLAIVLPLFLVTATGRKIPAFVLPVLLVAFTAYYLYTDYRFYQQDQRQRVLCTPGKNPWIYPLQHVAYLGLPRKPFPYTIMNTGTRLYYPLKGQPCDNTCLPCMPWHYGDIEMRGKTLEEGFRSVCTGAQ